MSKWSIAVLSFPSYSRNPVSFYSSPFAYPGGLTPLFLSSSTNLKLMFLNLLTSILSSSLLAIRTRIGPLLNASVMILSQRSSFYICFLKAFIPISINSRSFSSRCIFWIRTLSFFSNFSCWTSFFRLLIDLSNVFTFWLCISFTCLSCASAPELPFLTSSKSLLSCLF